MKFVEIEATPENASDEFSKPPSTTKGRSKFPSRNGYIGPGCSNNVSPTAAGVVIRAARYALSSGSMGLPP